MSQATASILASYPHTLGITKLNFFFLPQSFSSSFLGQTKMVVQKGVTYAPGGEAIPSSLTKAFLVQDSRQFCMLFRQCHSQGETSADLHSNYSAITQAILFHRYLLDRAIRVLYTASDSSLTFSCLLFLSLLILHAQVHTKQQLYISLDLHKRYQMFFFSHCLSHC